MSISGITVRQREYVESLLHQLHIAESTALARCPGIEATDTHGLGIPDLSREGASILIDWLIQIRDGHAPMPAPAGQTSLFGGVS